MRVLRLLAVLLATSALVSFGGQANAAEETSEDPEKLQLVIVPEGSTEWQFSFPLEADELATNAFGPATRAFGAGIFTGKFDELHVESGYLIWGAQSSCTASNNQFYLHKVKVELHDSCLYGLCIIFEKIKTIYSPSYSNYSRVATASGRDYCLGGTWGNSRTYEQRVWVTVRSVTYGIFAQTAGVPNCDINP